MCQIMPAERITHSPAAVSACRAARLGIGNSDLQLLFRRGWRTIFVGL